MKITKLHIQNYLGIACFETDDLGHLNLITGDNGVGKSTILLAIREAMESSGKNPDLIHDNEDRAEIFIELDGRIEIERRITPTSNTVKVTEDGVAISKPQAYLNAIAGPLAFKPVDFFKADIKAQRQMLLSAMPIKIHEAQLSELLGPLADHLDLEALNYEQHGLELLQEAQSVVYDGRKEQNRSLTQLKGAITERRSTVPDGFDAGKYSGYDARVRIAEMLEARVALSNHGHHKGELANMKGQRASLDDNAKERATAIRADIKRAQAMVVRLEQDLQTLDTTTEQEGIKLDSEIEGLSKAIDGFEPPDVAAMQSSIDEFNAAQPHLETIRVVESMSETMRDSVKAHTALDDLYKALTTSVPRKILSSIELPIPGLAIGRDSILIDGRSIDTLSTSERMRFAVKVARAICGKLMVICIDRFESLGQKARLAFEEEADGDGFEYFISTVTDGDLKMLNADKTTTENEGDR